jgi:hypothetical protein
MKKFIRICDGLNDRGTLLPADEFDDTFEADTDFYRSVYYYNEEHVKRFEEKGSIKGITDVLTDKLTFDFDKKDDLEAARKDALTVIDRMTNYHSIDFNNIEIYFSGHKGFTVQITLDRLITPEQHSE